MQVRFYCLKDMKKTEVGLYRNGVFCPLWGGLYTACTEPFEHGALPNLSRTLKANIADAGVVVWYED